MYMTENSNSKNQKDKVWVKLSCLDTILLRIADYVVVRIQKKYDPNRKYNYMGYDPDDFKKVRRLAVYYTNIPKPWRIEATVSLPFIATKTPSYMRNERRD